MRIKSCTAKPRFGQFYNKKPYKNGAYLAAALLTAACQASGPTAEDASAKGVITFENVTDAVGLKSEESWKYGGPSIADFNGDGVYDFIVGNHDTHPTVLWYGSKDGKVTLHNPALRAGDVHGGAPADYDNDGDVDVIIGVGGGNGTRPSPPRLLRNDDGVFVDVTEESGIAELGARGRSVRWLDVDLDGDLDLLHIVARQLPNETGPRNTLFENIGGGKFKFRESPGVQQTEAERVLITDFNNDNISDLVLFEPLSLWQGDGTFTYKDVTNAMMPEGFEKSEFITAAADADFDNDGDRDLYLTRGKVYYQMANNSLDFDAETGRLDLRDKGGLSHDGLSFTADGDVELSKFWHFRRKAGLVLPVYLGAAQTRMDTPLEAMTVSPDQAEGFPETHTENGWHLGHLGGGKWRLEWRLDGDIAWGLRATVKGVSSVNPDFVPQKYNDVPDVLLENKDGKFVDVSSRLPKETKGNNWGVTHGDFDNDGYEDYFVYRFGGLNKRVPDALLHNKKGAGFDVSVTHGAFVEGLESHGDMGAAFDYDLDGRIDMLNGDDDLGRWNLYKNQTDADTIGRHLLVQVGYSETNIDPMGAVVTVVNADGLEQIKDVGSAGAVHAQSLMSTLHFGLGGNGAPVQVTVRWRDGTTEVLAKIQPNQRLSVGEFPNSKTP